MQEFILVHLHTLNCNFAKAQTSSLESLKDLTTGLELFRRKGILKENLRGDREAKMVCPYNSNTGSLIIIGPGSKNYYKNER